MHGKWHGRLFLERFPSAFLSCLLQKEKAGSGSVQRRRELQGVLGLPPGISAHFSAVLPTSITLACFKSLKVQPEACIEQVTIPK